MTIFAFKDEAGMKVTGDDHWSFLSLSIFGLGLRAFACLDSQLARQIGQSLIAWSDRCVKEKRSEAKTVSALCLEWKPRYENEFARELHTRNEGFAKGPMSYEASIKTLRLSVVRLDKDCTRFSDNPIIGDGVFWAGSVRENNYYDEEVGQCTRHTDALSAQLEAERVAREYLSHDWFLLNPNP